MKESKLVRLIIVAVLILFISLWIAVGEFAGAFILFSVLGLALLLIVSVGYYIISNVPILYRKIRGIDWAEHIQILEEKGLAIREHYNTKHALEFEDNNTGCLVYLIDIGGDRILCLYGQDYYDYVPIDDDPEINQSRKFPTHDFIIVKRKKDNDLLDLIPSTNVFDPTIIKEPNIKGFYELNPDLIDGAIIENMSFNMVLSLVQ